MRFFTNFAQQSKNGHEDMVGIGVPNLVRANTLETGTDS